MPTPPEGGGRRQPGRTGHAFRDALRLLFILVRGSEPLPEGARTEDWDRVFVG